MLHDTYRTTGGSSAIDGRPYGRRLDTIANANGYENGCFREVYGKLPNIEWLYQQAMYIVVLSGCISCSCHTVCRLRHSGATYFTALRSRCAKNFHKYMHTYMCIYIYIYYM